MLMKQGRSKSFFSSLLCLVVLIHSAFSLFLTATSTTKQDIPANAGKNGKQETASGFKSIAPSFTSATKTENGIQYEYSNDNGVERLRVLGRLTSSFDADVVMQEFRDALHLEEVAPSCGVHAPADEKKREDDKEARSLLESFTDYFKGSKLAYNVQKYYEAFTSREQTEQIELAKSELITVEDDLTKVQTQKLILSKRQSELGAWIRDDLKKPMEERNPTVEELVHTESDRLALLEHRLQRLENKLLQQKNEITGYLRMQDRVRVREMYEKLDEDTHIFTRRANAGCSASPSQTIIPDPELEYDMSVS